MSDMDKRVVKAAMDLQPYRTCRCEQCTGIRKLHRVINGWARSSKSRQHNRSSSPARHANKGKRHG